MLQADSGHLLQAVPEHRTVELLENVRPDFHDEIGTNAQDVLVEGSVMDLAQADAVGDDGVTLEMPVGQDVRRIEQCDVLDRKSTRLNSSHIQKSRMPSSA